MECEKEHSQSFLGGISCPVGIEQRVLIQHLTESDLKQWDAIDKIRDRLPNYAVVVISLLIALLSACITLLFTNQ